jgi:hypothetical protein
MIHVGTAASAVRRPKCIGAQFLWASFLDITHGLCSFDFAQGRLLAAILRSFGASTDFARAYVRTGFVAVLLAGGGMQAVCMFNGTLVLKS